MDASYRAPSVRVGASIQEQLNYLQMIVHSGPEEGGVSILREDRQEREASVYTILSGG